MSELEETLPDRLRPHVGHLVTIEEFPFPPGLLALECHDCRTTLLDTELWIAFHLYSSRNSRPSEA